MHGMGDSEEKKEESPRTLLYRSKAAQEAIATQTVAGGKLWFRSRITTSLTVPFQTQQTNHQTNLDDEQKIAVKYFGRGAPQPTLQDIITTGTPGAATQAQRDQKDAAERFLAVTQAQWTERETLQSTMANRLGNITNAIARNNGQDIYMEMQRVKTLGTEHINQLRDLHRREIQQITDQYAANGNLHTAMGQANTTTDELNKARTAHLAALNTQHEAEVQALRQHYATLRSNYLDEIDNKEEAYFTERSWRINKPANQTSERCLLSELDGFERQKSELGKMLTFKTRSGLEYTVTKKNRVYCNLNKLTEQDIEDILDELQRRKVKAARIHFVPGNETAAAERIRIMMERRGIQCIDDEPTLTTKRAKELQEELKNVEAKQEKMFAQNATRPLDDLHESKIALVAQQTEITQLTQTIHTFLAQHPGPPPALTLNEEKTLAGHVQSLLDKQSAFQQGLNRYQQQWRALESAHGRTEVSAVARQGKEHVDKLDKFIATQGTSYTAANDGINRLSANGQTQPRQQYDRQHPVYTELKTSFARDLTLLATAERGAAEEEKAARTAPRIR